MIKINDKILFLLLLVKKIKLKTFEKLNEIIVVRLFSIYY